MYQKLVEDERLYMMEKDFSDIDERFISYYMRGERVEAILKEGYELFMGYGCRTGGRVIRFYVGLSTGWRPVFLQILNRNSMGGMAISSEAIEDIRGLGIIHRGHRTDYMRRSRNFLDPYKEWKENARL